MATKDLCSICARPDRDRIDAAVRARTSLRSTCKTFDCGRTALTNHMLSCVTGLGRVVRPNRRGGRPKKGAAFVPAASLDLKPVESAEDVIADLQRLRATAFELFEGARGRADWKQAQMLFGQLVAIVDRFGEMHRVLGPKGGVAINIDARQQKVIEFYDALPTEVLRKLSAGETTIEALLEQGRDA
jgi:hypothetical protein